MNLEARKEFEQGNMKRTETFLKGNLNVFA